VSVSAGVGMEAAMAVAHENFSCRVG